MSIFSKFQVFCFLFWQNKLYLIVNSKTFTFYLNEEFFSFLKSFFSEFKYKNYE